LESAIRTAENKAYQETAEGATPVLDQMVAAPGAGSSRWVLGMISGLIVILGMGLMIVAIRRIGI